MATNKPSNARFKDPSCQNVGTTFYQCQECALEQVYMCGECFDNSEHKNHRKVQCSDPKVFFCNCGDATMLLYCSKHDKCELNTKAKPLFVNKEKLKIFMNKCSVPITEAMNVTRMNQIREIYFKSSDAKMINTYFEQSKAPGHSALANMKIKGLWSVYRKDMEIDFVSKGFNKKKRMLLWHGTKMVNLVRILYDGFRKPDSTRALMFGAGIYFADRVTKSASYSDGLLLLCEVAVGKWDPNLKGQSHLKEAPNHAQSVKGRGKFTSDVKGNLKYGDVIVPAGKTVNNRKYVVGQSALQYNEYIVYDPDQILVKFIVVFSK